MPLVDGFGRSFHYLRLSVDDACNFQCRYCLPHGFRRTDAEPLLSPAEIGRLTRAFAAMGFWKVRLTGGEPTLRPDFLEVAAEVAAAPGVRRVALSTNGWRLKELAPELARLGVAAVNVSVDSLNAARFAEITGQDRLRDVLAGVEACLALGLEVKLNAVLLKGLNDGDLDAFLAYVRERPVDARFIELMPAADNVELFAARHVKADALVARLLAAGWAERPRREGDGPARAFSHEGSRGGIGVIAPYGKDFCANCNRLRVTSRGRLRLCLFSEGERSLRDLLQDDGQAAALQERVRAQLGLKEVSHYLAEGKLGDMRHFAAMGG